MYLLYKEWGQFKMKIETNFEVAPQLPNEFIDDFVEQQSELEPNRNEELHILAQPIQCTDVDVEMRPQLAQALPINSCPPDLSIFDIEDLEAMFCLKLMAKHMLPEAVIDDIMSFSANIHDAKVDLIKATLKDRHGEDENITKVCRNIEIINKATNSGEIVSTHYRRCQ